VFATCLFCLKSLGANQRIEHFPIGRRLAFDAERGRLWAVCTKCGRWNLTPLEERWEAIEECERAYRDERRRVSTDHIGLARLNDGTDLVRIGQPLLPEFAAWRYGEQLRSRRKQYYWRTGLISGGMFALFAVPHLAAYHWLGIGALSMGGMQIYSTATMIVEARRPIGKIRLPDGTVESMMARHLLASRINVSPDGEIDAEIHYREGSRGGPFTAIERVLHVNGPEARTVMRDVMPVFNGAGGNRLEVHEAVQTVQQVGDELTLLKRYGAHRVLPERGRGAIHNGSFYLALEMLLHEEDERRAMAGELGQLYARWEDAERIAKIADGELTTLSQNPPGRS
jgi:hypothetical protein